MRQIIDLYALLIVALWGVTGCHPRQSFELEAFTQSLYKPQYAQGFEILSTAEGDATLIISRNPWQGAEGVEQMLLIDPEGRFKSSSLAEVQTLRAPAQRVVCMSSSYIAMLSALDASQSIVGVSGLKFISDQYVQSHSDHIGDVGYDNHIDYERLVALDPDLVLLYGVNSASSIERKLRELGIAYAYIGEYIEQSPLGKAEWVVALSYMIGRAEKGVQHFSTIPQRYNHLKSLAAQCTSRPKVMVNTPYGDNWYMPSTQSYMAQLIEDAAGDYIYRRNTSTTSEVISQEEAYLFCSSAERWINVGQIGSLGELKSRYPKFADTQVVKSGEVYNCDKRATEAGGNDFWESGVVRPDIILADLIKIFHPELPHSLQGEATGSEGELLGGETYYYKRLE